MSDSLRDQLLGLGFSPIKKPVPNKPSTQSRTKAKTSLRTHAASGAQATSTHSSKAISTTDKRGASDIPSPHPSSAAKQKIHHQPTKAKNTEHAAGMNLAKAYALRAEKEKQERIAEEQRKQDVARAKRQRKAQFAQVMRNQALNHPEASVARHFLYENKIKRVYVTEEQLTALNAGQLGVVFFQGRHILVGAETLSEVEALMPTAIALKVDPNNCSSTEADADPRFRVPDDLIW